ncbi:unnamed protein product [Musa acuminata subsp. burmannicoides]
MTQALLLLALSWRGFFLPSCITWAHLLLALCMGSTVEGLHLSPKAFSYSLAEIHNSGTHSTMAGLSSLAEMHNSGTCSIVVGLSSLVEMHNSSTCSIVVGLSSSLAKTHNSRHTPLFFMGGWEAVLPAQRLCEWAEPPFIDCHLLFSSPLLLLR